MSENVLNNVIRVLRASKEYLNLAEFYTETYLHDHNATLKVHELNLALSDIIKYFNIKYRKSHY